MLYGPLKLADDQGGKKAGGQVNPEPECAPPRAGEYRGKHVIFAQSGHASDRLFSLFLDDVHHVVNSDASEQHVPLVNYGRGKQVTLFEHPGDFGR